MHVTNYDYRIPVYIKKYHKQFIFLRIVYGIFLYVIFYTYFFKSEEISIKNDIK